MCVAEMLSVWSRAERRSQGECRSRRRPCRVCWYVWMAIVVGLVAAVVMDARHRESRAGYRSQVSVDEMIMALTVAPGRHP